MSTRSLRMVGSPTADDVAQSTESWTVLPGQSHRVSAWCQRPTGVGVGRLRLRTVYEGQFRHADVLAGDGDFEDVAPWTDTSPAPGDAEVVRYSTHPTHGLGAARLGPTTRPQVLVNGGFEDGLTHWTNDPLTEGTWVEDPTNAFEGMSSALIDDSDVLAVKTLHYEEKFPVVPGEKWRLDGRLRAETGTDGAAHFLLVVDHGLLFELGTWHHGNDVRGTSAETEGWQYGSVEVEIDTEYVGVGGHIQVRDHTAGYWAADDVRLTRIEGNTCSLVGEPHAITPSRRYDVRCNVESDVGVTKGAVSVLLRLSGPGRTDRVVESSTAGPTAGASREVQLSLDVPSGYDTVVAELQGRDIEGGSFWVDELTITDADASTFVVDTVRSGTGLDWARLILDASAPSGAEKLRIEAIAEDGGDGWVVTDFAVERIGERVWTTGEVVADLLLHPETGNPLLAPGVVVGDEATVYDWRVSNLTVRSALRHLSRAGVASPTREWRTNPDLTLDWGSAADLFADRTEIVFGPDDIHVLAEPETQTDLTDVVERVLVVGAERADTPGPAFVVTGSAEAADGPRDWFGHRLRRTLLVEDSTVDSSPYASSLAAYELERSQVPPQNVRLSLADWRGLGAFGVGDWIYVFAPEAGLVDPANERMDAGRLTYPKRVRAVSRTWRLGAGHFHVRLRASDGTETDITDWVRWEAATTADLEVGDLLPEFAPDPQGGAVGNQFLRYRASSPR